VGVLLPSTIEGVASLSFLCHPTASLLFDWDGRIALCGGGCSINPSMRRDTEMELRRLSLYLDDVALGHVCVCCGRGCLDACLLAAETRGHEGRDSGRARQASDSVLCSVSWHRVNGRDIEGSWQCRLDSFTPDLAEVRCERRFVYNVEGSRGCHPHPLRTV
jgi:hypothetical protein